MSNIYAVVGATGQQGGAVARALLASGAGVRALVRRPDSDAAGALAGAGAELLPQRGRLRVAAKTPTIQIAETYGVEDTADTGGPTLGVRFPSNAHRALLSGPGRTEPRRAGPS